MRIYEIRKLLNSRLMLSTGYGGTIFWGESGIFPGRANNSFGPNPSANLGSIERKEGISD